MAQPATAKPSTTDYLAMEPSSSCCSCRLPNCSSCCSTIAENIFPIIAVGTRIFCKSMLTYYGATKFIEANDAISEIAWLATFIQNVLPIVDGVQTVFVGGSSGIKTIKALQKTPKQELRSFWGAIKSHYMICAIVGARLMSDGILRSTVIDHSLSQKMNCSANWAWPLAIVFSSINALSDLKFGAASDLRLLKRLTHQPLAGDLADSEADKVTRILATSLISDNLVNAYDNLEDCRTIRHAVRKDAFRRAYFANNPNPSEHDLWQFTQTKNTLVMRSSRYAWYVEAAARVTSFAVNFPFFYLTFLKNYDFAKGGEKAHSYNVGPVVWACIASLLKVMTSQGKPVEALCDTYSELGRHSFGKIARESLRKPHAFAFCLLGILPFGVFGAGQILSIPNKLNWVGHKGALAMLGVFVAFQIPSYMGYIPPRVFERTPACCCTTRCCHTGAKIAAIDGGDFDEEDGMGRVLLVSGA